MRARARWAAPLAVAVAIGGATAARSATADVTPNLPDRTPQQVLALAAQAHVQAMSGTVVSTTDLGLPSLPSSMRGGARDATGRVMALLGGTTTVRYWYDGPSRVRAQVMDQMAETDLVRNGTDVWTYDSRSNAATHLTLPADAHAGSAHPGSGEPDGTPPSPQALAQRVLDAVDPTTKVTLDPPARIAGRDAYVLRVTPRTDATLVRDVTVAVDAKTGLPLRVVVDARGQQAPAVDVGYTALQLGTPPAARFDFTPPKDATVTQRTLPQLPAHEGKPSDHTGGAHAWPDKGTASGGDRPTVIGQGWTSVLALPAPTGTGGQAEQLPAQARQLLDAVSQPVAGGRLVTTSLLSVLIRDDGRVFVGAVPAPTLEAAAAKVR